MLPQGALQLPIGSYCDAIISALRRERVLIVAGDTGSGKSTVLPLLCREAGLGRSGRIAVTQPRRIAAVTLAGYAASLDGTPLGVSIGYKIRYRQRLEKNASIVYMTDGILVASLAADPLLEDYEVVIIDEAHERSMNIDFLLGYMRLLLQKRPDLRCIITSATIDTRLFSRAFNNAPVITVRGRRFGVEIRYRPVVELWKGYSIDSFIEGAVVAAESICAESREGDILIFFPTVADVVETVNRLRRRIREPEIQILPLHGRLSRRSQLDVFRRYPGRKIVVATNIAETSLTVPDIRFVIDTGLVRMLRYEPSASISRMPVEKTSQASADQRAGRCGRVADGVCIRLYSEQDYLSRPRFTTPEIMRADLAGTILRILSLDAGDPGRFPFLQRPPSSALAEGYGRLKELGALDRQGRITPLGRAMARFPLDPSLACMLLRAHEFGAEAEILVIAAALSVEEPLASSEGEKSRLPDGLCHPTSDFMTYLNVWKYLTSKGGNGKRGIYSAVQSFAGKYRLQHLRLLEWRDAHEHLLRICKEIPGFGSCRLPERSSYEAIHKSLLAGLPWGIAYRKDTGVYEGTAASEIRIASSSVTLNKQCRWLLFHEMVETDHVYGIRAALIDPVWVEQLFSERCSYRHEDPRYDPVCGSVRIREEVTYRSITLIRNRMVDCHKVDRPLAQEVFVREALVSEGAGERYRFIRLNRLTRERIASAEIKLRRRLYEGDGVLEAFYAERLSAATRRELDRILRERGNDSWLIIPVDALLTEPLPADIDEYADEIVVASHRLHVSWEHAPESESDGATVTVPYKIAEDIPQYWWEWQLPVFCKARISLLVSRITTGLLAKKIDPADVVDRMAERLTVPTGHWIEEARRFLLDEYGTAAGDSMLDAASYPLHLWLRIRVVDEDGKVVSVFRPPLSFWERNSDAMRRRPTSLNVLCEELLRRCPSLWNEAPLLLPAQCASAGQKVPCILFPALYKRENGTAIGVFSKKNAAYASHAYALLCLLEERLAEQLTWEIEAVSIPAAMERRAGQCGVNVPMHRLVESILIRTAIRIPDDLPRTAPEFEKLALKAASEIPGHTKAITTLLDQTFNALELCFRYLEKRKRQYGAHFYESVLSELNETLDRYRRLLISENTPVDYIMMIPHFLNVFPLRGDAALLDPVRYRSVMREISESLELVEATAAIGDYLIDKERWKTLAIIEQYCIDLFAKPPNRRKHPISAHAVERARLALQRAVTAFYRE